MKKLFFILLLIIIASFNAHGSTQCSNLFNTQQQSLKIAIDDLIAPFDMKRRLIKQTRYHKNINDFVSQFFNHIEDAYSARLADILYGKDHSMLLGFKSPNDAKTLKNDLILKMIQILSLMKPEDLTLEFKNDFLNTVTEIYSANVSKDDILRTTDRYDRVILTYIDID